MAYEIQESNGTRVLNLKGKWTIDCASELRTVLMDAMRDADHVALNLEKVTEVDLACLQLFCSAHRASLDSHTTFSWHTNPHDGFKKVVREAGYSRTLGCHKDPCKSCLWARGCES